MYRAVGLYESWYQPQTSQVRLSRVRRFVVLNGLKQLQSGKPKGNTCVSQSQCILIAILLEAVRGAELI